MLPVYIYPSKKTSQERGKSEKEIKKKLEKQGWEVWRSASINFLYNPDLFPVVLKKYQRLHMLLDAYYPKEKEYIQLLAAVHHGLPDFICFRQGIFKFIECKRGYEQLSDAQKICIPKLQELGFIVELHILGYLSTKTTKAILKDGKKKIVERQQKINSFK